MTKSVLFGTALGLALAASPALVAQETGDADVEAATSEEASEMTKGEKRLAKLIEGRVAGEPLNCIRTLPNDRLTVIEDTAYVYGRGGTIYVQRTKNPDRIDRHDTLVSRRFNATQLCRQDVMTTIDPVSGIFTGAVFFEDFVPYRKAEKVEEAS